jgi:hypothetical protein
MLELEKLGGLSYQKGCYPGQEVIARLHYRGELKRRLYRCRCDAETVWPPGTGLYASDDEESIGEVVTAERSRDGDIVILAVLKNSAVQSENVQLSRPQEITLKVSSIS